MTLIDTMPSSWKFSYKKYVGSCNTKLNGAKYAKGKIKIVLVITVGEMADNVNCVESATVPYTKF